MGRAGLKDNYLLKLNTDWEAYSLLVSSRERKDYDAELQGTLKLLKESVATKNIYEILDIEQITLKQEQELYCNSPEESNSIKTALIQLEEAKSALSVVRNHEAYQSVAKTYSSRRTEAGLPLDAFREFLKSHSTRLTNRLTAPLSVPEKNILRQRKENLRAVKEIYMGLQQEALELPALKKEPGLER